MYATPTKLRSGEWGAKTTFPVVAGQVITIRSKAGKEWTAHVGKVIWSGDGVHIMSTEKAQGGTPRMGAGHGQAAKVAGYSSYCTDRHDCTCFDCR
jgi:hypothetical protein